MAFGNLAVVLLVMTQTKAAGADEDRWWPIQTMPSGVVRTRDLHMSSAQHMLVQSIAGLAAKSVNQKIGDEVVWVSSDNPNLEYWYTSFLKKHVGVEARGEFSPWELVDRYSKRSLIKGYILYSADKSAGQVNDRRPGMDQSVNVATSLAGLLDGILVDETQEEEAKQHGLTMLLDVRGKTPAWCFTTYQNRFNRRLLCAQDPRKGNLRDLAITQQALVLFGDDEPMEAALKWLEPLSPIAGWNGGDEFKTTRLSSIYGHFQTATDWCMNLPVLMAGSDQAAAAPLRSFDPQGIDWGDRRSCVSFALSDGDNVQWLETTFFRGNPNFWGSADRGKIPFGWSCCPAHLAQLCPVVLDHLLETQKENDRIIEWGGGYYYPDLFGQARRDRAKLLAKHAKRTWSYMQKTGTQIVAFNVADIDSPDALKAYQTFVRETDGLLAVLVFQYAPYEGGEGQTFWVKDRKGVEVPVISARYSIWEHANDRARAGTPAKIAREIRESAAGKMTRDDWVIVHAWSYFRRAPGAGEEAENMPQEKAESQGGLRGYSPALWCSEQLPKEVRVVTPEELAWRTRMKHDPTTTKRLIKKLQNK